MKTMNFVNLRYYKNQTKAKNPTNALVKKSVYYYGYGTDVTLPDGTTIYPEEMRGQWWSGESEQKHGEVVAWASENALEHTYTYTMILSLRDGQMEPQDFIQAMNSTASDYFDDYRLIVHYDTEHDHAHVVAFRDKVLRREDFNEFRLAMRGQLAELESQRLEEKIVADTAISIYDEMDWEDDLEL